MLEFNLMTTRKSTPYEALYLVEAWISEQTRLFGADQTAFLSQVSQKTDAVGQSLLYCRGDLLGIDVLNFAPLVIASPPFLLRELALNYLERIQGIVGRLRTENQDRDDNEFDFGAWGIQWHPPRRSKKGIPPGCEMVNGRWQVLGEDFLYLPGGGGARARSVLWLVKIGDETDVVRKFKKVITLTGIARNTKIRLNLKVGDVFCAPFYETQSGVMYPVNQIERDSIVYEPELTLAGDRIADLDKTLDCAELPKLGNTERLIILRDVTFGRIGHDPVLYDSLDIDSIVPLANSSFSDLAPLANMHLDKVVASWNGFYATVLRASTSHGAWLYTPKRVCWYFPPPNQNTMREEIPPHMHTTRYVEAISCPEVRVDTVSPEIRLILTRLWDLNGRYFWWPGIRFYMDRANVSAHEDDLRKYPLVESRKSFSLISDIAWDRDYRLYETASRVQPDLMSFGYLNFLVVQKIRRLRSVNKQTGHVAALKLMDKGNTYARCWDPGLVNAFHIELTSDDLPFLQRVLASIDDYRMRQEALGPYYFGPNSLTYEARLRVASLISFCPGSPTYESRLRVASRILQYAPSISAQERDSVKEENLFSLFGGFTFSELCPDTPLKNNALTELVKEWPLLSGPLAMVALESEDIDLAVSLLETADRLTWPDDAIEVSSSFMSWTRQRVGEETTQKFIEKSFLPGRSKLGRFRSQLYIFLEPFSYDFSQMFVDFYLGDENVDVETLTQRFAILPWGYADTVLLFGEAIRPFIAKLSYGSTRLACAMMDLIDALNEISQVVRSPDPDLYDGDIEEIDER